MVLHENFAPVDFIHLLEASRHFRQQYLHACQTIYTNSMLDELRKDKKVDLLDTMRLNIIEFTLSKDFTASLVRDKVIGARDVAVAGSNMFKQVAKGGRVVLSFQDALALSTVVHAQAMKADYHEDGRIDISHVDEVIETKPLIPDNRYFILFPGADGKDVIQPSYDRFDLFSLAKGFLRDNFLSILFTGSY